MVGSEIGQKQKIAILIGTSIFVTDFATGWLSYITAWIPMVFVLALVIGILAGNIEDGAGALILTLIIGNVIGAFLLPLVWSSVGSSGAGISLEGIVGLLIFAPAYAMRGWLLSVGSVPFDEAVLASFIAAPGLYLLSFVFVAIGGRIAEYMRNEPEDTSDLQDSGFPKNENIVEV